MPSMYSLPIAVLFFTAEAVKLKHGSAAVSSLLKSQGPGKVDTKTLVASLTEVSKGLESEDSLAVTMRTQSRSQCKKTAQDLTLALNKGRRAVEMGTDDYDKVNSQVNALDASLSELKGQIDNSNTELNNLQAKLKKMRQDKGLLKKAASSALRQVEKVIVKTKLRAGNEARKGPSALDQKATHLEKLSESLSFLQSNSEQDSDDEDDSDDDAEERRRDVEAASKSKPLMLLKADKQAVVQASSATQKGFNEEEKKILDLVESERKKLADLEDNMQDLQPAIANKLKQAMEINRTLDAANQGIQRDSELMAAEKKKCDSVEKNIGAQVTERKKVINDVKMSAKVLESMDTFLFLSQDLAGLQHAPQKAAAHEEDSSVVSFLQVVSETNRQLANETAAVLSLLQEGEGEGTDAESGMGMEEVVDNYESQGVLGPFDKVNKMIQGLIASLKAQANQEVNQHQFCQDSLGKNRRERIAKKNNIDTLVSTIRWSKMALVRLDDDLKYLTAEMKRLGEVQATEAKELKAENQRVNKEFSNHKLADEVVTKAMVILAQLCDLKQGNAAAALIQDKDSGSQAHKVGSKFNQCNEASKLLNSASKNLKSLNTMTKSYVKEYGEISKGIAEDAKSAADARDTEAKSTKAAQAERASELATAQKDVKEAEAQLKLIDDAKKELEHQCSHVETREEKMARRQEEIDALKEALNVLSGEAIPA